MRERWTNGWKRKSKRDEKETAGWTETTDGQIESERERERKSRNRQMD